jgi:5-methylcytosine-specific restriction endonuclease McrA
MLQRGMTTIEFPKDFTDAKLLFAVARAAKHERAATAHLIALLAEVDARRLYLGEGYSSLFTYCRQALHLSEHAAYGRIEAARAARRFPVLMDLLADGSLNLTTVGVLAPHLTADNHQSVFNSARYKSKREVESMVAALRPLPAVRSSIRKLPAPVRLPQAAEPTERAGDHELIPSTESLELDPNCRTANSIAQPVVSRPSVIAPLAPIRYSIKVTVSAEAHDHLRRAQDLLRHVIPSGDPALIVERALTLLVAHVERTRCAHTARPRRSPAARPGSRHVPAAVRRAVWARDNGQCAFVGHDGRCRARGFLEIHHVIPFAAGGETVVDNLQLRCRAHNAYEAEEFFGPRTVRETQTTYSVQTDFVRLARTGGKQFAPPP